MAISLRRALLSYRNVSLLLRSTSVHSHGLSYSSPSTDLRRPSRAFPDHPTINFMLQSRRNFAKGKKQKISDDDSDDDDDGHHSSYSDQKKPEIQCMLQDSIKNNTVIQMEAAIEALTRELAKLRTGRASPGMLDHIIVESHGEKTPLNRMAAVSVLDSKTLSVTPYDPNTLKELEKAIVSSPLGLNPKPDNQRLIAPIPPLTKEHMQAVCKVVAKSSEDVKQSIRRARQRAIDTIKKAAPKKKGKEKISSQLSEDEARKLEKEVDDLTKKYIKSAEDLCKAKEKEISAA